TNDFEVGFEAVHLPAVCVAPNGDVEGVEHVLVWPPVGDAVSEDDHPGARAERGQACAHRSLDLLEQAHPLHQHRHGRALTARDDQAVEPLQVSREPHQSYRGAASLQGLDMLTESPLQRQHPYKGGVHATNRGRRAVPPGGWSSTPIPSSAGPDRSTRRPECPACRSRSLRPRWPWLASAGPPT